MSSLLSAVIDSEKTPDVVDDSTGALEQAPLSSHQSNDSTNAINVSAHLNSDNNYNANKGWLYFFSDNYVKRFFIFIVCFFVI